MTAAFLNPLADLDMHGAHLPHWQQNGITCFVTWRLADSLPATLLREWEQERSYWLKRNPLPWTPEQVQEYHHEFSERIDRWLDQGMGSCVLANQGHASLIAATLHHDNGVHYDLHAFVIIPTHVHALFTLKQGCRLEKIIQAWKGVSARRLGKEFGVKPPVWQAGYWDRLIRNVRHFRACVRYIRDNPRKARLGDGLFVVWTDEGVRPPFHTSRATERR